MAMFDPGNTICPICGNPVMDKSDFLAFTCLGTLPSAYSRLDDGVVHRSCLSKWDQRDDFLKHWNMAVNMSSLDPKVHRLGIHDGLVKYEEDIPRDVEQDKD